MRARIFAEETRRWFTLAAVSFGLFMIMLDNTVVNVALPAIQRDLGADLSELQWVVTGYALTFAALMLIGGKVADAYGRRLIFVVGIAIFTTASLWCGLADSSDELLHGERLDEIVVGADLECMDTVVLRPSCADHDDRRPDAFRSRLLDEAPAVHAGQHQVDDADLGILEPQPGESRLPVAR